MKRTHMLLATSIFLMALPSLFGQDVENKETKDKEKVKETVIVKDDASPDVPVKVQILLTEFDGTQKISSLPYTMYTLASPPRSREHNAHLRFGVKIPIRTSAGSNSQITYEDVGTNIDCTARQLSDAQYSLECTVERTSVSMRGTNGEESEWKPGNENPGPQPLVRSFRDNFTLIMRDGHTMEGTSAVDPVTGHVLKVEVTVNVLK
jgi:hypothetical protein